MQIVVVLFAEIFCFLPSGEELFFESIEQLEHQQKLKKENTECFQVYLGRKSEAPGLLKAPSMFVLDGVKRPPMVHPNVYFSI